MKTNEKTDVQLRESDFIKISQYAAPNEFRTLIANLVKPTKNPEKYDSSVAMANAQIIEYNKWVTVNQYEKFSELVCQNLYGTDPYLYELAMKIKHIDKDNTTVAGVVHNNNVVIWVISKSNDFDIFETSAEFINDYIIKQKKYIEGVFVRYTKFKDGLKPKFTWEF
ncbi:hypothetical protein AGMMS50284_1200 [Clostridia bacterium]|nr:hypothetical protein AGMMS50284_1200 [Clostridia bacterium]